MLLAFHKPYGVLCQFSKDGSTKQTLADFNFPKHVYPLGRLDTDSEGLLLLSDEAELNDLLLNPKHQHRRSYWVQVEGVLTPEAMETLEKGVLIQGRKTLPCKACLINPQPNIPDRNPPIRYRKSIPTSWMELVLIEGKNRQVRRMTATIGFPTLRLIRMRIGNFELGDLALGTWRELNSAERTKVFQ
jgi:23S rRNA pseudouridine2457 synthase